jgi:tRNA-splicing ligase RtcB
MPLPATCVATIVAMLLKVCMPITLCACAAQGCFPGADPSKVSSRAKARGTSQCGTLGSGKRYVEVQDFVDVGAKPAKIVFGNARGRDHPATLCNKPKYNGKRKTDHVC